MDNIKQLVWRLFEFHEELIYDFFVIPFDIPSKGYDYCEYWDLQSPSGIEFGLLVVIFKARAPMKLFLTIQFSQL